MEQARSDRRVSTRLSGRGDPAASKTRLRIALVALALLFGLMPGNAAHAANGTLSGIVTEAGGGAPLAGVTVQAFCWDVEGSGRGDVCGETHTATDGTYALQLAAGTYKVLFDDWPDYRIQYYGGGTDLWDDDSAEVWVPSGSVANGIDAALVRLRTVAGMVTGNGTAVSGINVTAYRQSGDALPAWESALSTVSESDGTYALHLPDGTYRVGFADARGPYRTEFFEDAEKIEQADDIVVAGDDVAAIDADLALNHPITGTVTVDGVNMPGVVVTAWQWVQEGSEPAEWKAAKWITTVAEGAYALYLPDGTYRVQFSTWQADYPPMYYDGASRLDDATDVVVAGAEVPNVDAAIVSKEPDSGPPITGTVTVAGAAGPPDDVVVTAWRWNSVVAQWVRVRETTTAFDGTYVLRVPEGTYRVGFSHSFGRYQPVYYDGADDIDLADDIVVPTEGVPNVDAQLVENRSISGTITVEPQEGLPPGVPPGTIATAWRRNDLTSQWELVAEAYADIAGNYVLYVADGTYRIAFSSDFFDTWPPVYYDGAQTIDKADDVVVAGANVANINGHLASAQTEPEPAEVWPPAVALSEAGQDAWQPQVAVGPQGAVTAVWYRRDGHHNRVQATTRAANRTWSSPVALSRSGEDAWDPQVATGANGRSVVVWRRWSGSGYQVQASTRAASHGPWSAPVALSVAGEDAWDAQVAVGGQGRAVVVWRRSTESGYQVRASTRSAKGSWSAPVSLSAATADAWGPRVAMGPDGTALAVWSHSDGSHYRVQASVMPADGSWATPVALSQGGADAWDPQPVMGAGRAATVVWRRNDGSSDRIQAASRDTRGAWATPVSLSPAGRDAHDAQVAMGPDGVVTAVWSDWDGDTDRVHASSVAPAGAWSTPQALSQAGEHAQGPRVSSGPDGRSTVIWRRTNGVNEWVQVITRRPDGSWRVPTDLMAAGVRAYGAEVATGSDGTVAAVWEWRDVAHDRVHGVVLDPIRQTGGRPDGR